MIERDRFIDLMARFMAELAPSVTRGQPPGTRKAAREYLVSRAEKLLSELAVPATFHAVLDSKTAELASYLPEHSWGIARKWLNIFLRDATFNFYLRRQYELCGIEPLLEVPLDSHVAENLRKRCPGLTPWISIKKLEPDVSATYQKAALALAKEHDVEPIHLDLWFYPNS